MRTAISTWSCASSASRSLRRPLGSLWKTLGTTCGQHGAPHRNDHWRIEDPAPPAQPRNRGEQPVNSHPDNGKLTDEGLKTLGHEVGHVWQNQNGGGDYIHNALGSQLIAKITDGDRDAAYDWRKALRDGETFESMNDEERAKVMEDIGGALKNDGMITSSDGVRGAGTADTSDDKPAYTPEELAFLRDTAQKIKYGEGAG